MATTVTFGETGSETYSGVTEDTFIRDDTYSTTNYNGSDLVVKEDASAGFTRRALVKFDISDLKAIWDADTMVVTNAYLTLYQSSTTAGDLTVAVQHRVNWAEATATWDTEDGTNAWPYTTYHGAAINNDSNFHADLTPLASAGSRNTTSNQAIIDYVHSILSGYCGWSADVAGFTIYDEGTPGTAFTFSDSENATAANRPVLTITYDTLTTDTATVGTTGVKDYSTLGSWESGEQTDLVTATTVHICNVDSEEFDVGGSRLQITGWTTNPQYRVILQGVGNVDASGFSTTATATLRSSLTSTSTGILNIDEVVTVRDFQIHGDSGNTSGTALHLTADTNSRYSSFHRIYIKADEGRKMLRCTDSFGYFQNILITLNELTNDFAVESDPAAMPSVYHNCQVYVTPTQSSYSAYRSTSTLAPATLINCISFQYNFATSSGLTYFTTDSDYNAWQGLVSSGSRMPGSNTVHGITDNWDGAAVGGDFTYTTFTDIHEQGTDLSAFFSDTIEGKGRASSWTIGAWEVGLTDVTTDFNYQEEHLLQVVMDDAIQEEHLLQVDVDDNLQTEHLSLNSRVFLQTEHLLQVDADDPEQTEHLLQVVTDRDLHIVFAITKYGMVRTHYASLGQETRSQTATTSPDYRRHIASMGGNTRTL